jgi:hypothetical protein
MIEARIKAHLARYHELLQDEETRLRALAGMIEGTRRAVILARLQAIDASLRKLEETFERLPPVPQSQ